MKRTVVRDALSCRDFGSEMTVAGWVRTRRDSKAGFSFIELNDGSCQGNLQVVAPTSLPNYDSEIVKLHPGASVKVTGTLVASEGKGQAVDLKATDVKVLGFCDPMEYPLGKTRISFERLREVAHLRPRTNTFQATFRVRSVVAAAIHEFFQQRGFVYVHTPILTGSDCEGAGEMFQVTTLPMNELPKGENGEIDFSKDFFGKPVNLTVSGQLYGEAFALAFRDIYTFGPTFRAEYSFTARHAAEFWMIEPEMAFCDLAGDMDVAEAMVKYIINAVLERCPAEMEFFNKFMDKGLLDRLDNVVNSDFIRISYTEAVKILQESGQEFKYPVAWGDDLQTEHERYLTEQVYKKPVFVTDYPAAIKAFYMRLNDDGKTVAAADLLVPGVGEIIGGSQREERYDVLKQKCADLGLDMSQYDWYLDLRKYGGVKHAGFGLGFERMVMYVTGMANIRDVLPFPRTAANLEM